MNGKRMIFASLLIVTAVAVGWSQDELKSTGSLVTEWHFSAGFPSDERRFRRLAKENDRDGDTRLPCGHPMLANKYVVAKMHDGFYAIDDTTGKIEWGTKFYYEDNLEDFHFINRPGRDLPPLKTATGFDFAFHTLFAPKHLMIDSNGRSFFMAEPCWRFRYASFSARVRIPFGDEILPTPLSAVEMSADVKPYKWKLVERKDKGAAPRTLGLKYALGGLYCVVEQEGKLALRVLTTDLKQEIWRCTLREKLDESKQQMRTYAGCPLAIDTDTVVAVCTGGKIVGVDRRKHTIRWSHDYPTSETLPEDADRWQQAEVRIASDQVIVAPGDIEWLYALDLADGSMQWKLPREKGMYFDIVGDRVMIASPQSVRFYALQTGNALGDAIHLPTDDFVAGHSDVHRKMVLLPVSSKSILWIDPIKQKLIRRVDVEFRPGNLVVGRDALYSQNGVGVTKYRLH